MQSITELQTDLPVLAMVDLLNKAVQLSNENSSADRNSHFGL